ncbi:MAG TPA: hypothetical protein VI844_01385 [Coxiellaceae bacterium]|nr:hypothetical protein [Coxiellaceae bacterium]
MSRDKFKEGLVDAAYHVADFSLMTLKTQTFIARWLHQLFVELEQYDRAPSNTAQQTWLGLPIIGTAAFCALTLKIMNHWYARAHDGKYLAAQDYFYALFLSVYGLFFTDLIRGSQQAHELSLPAFIGINAISVPFIAAFFFKFTTPDSHNRLNFSIKEAEPNEIPVFTFDDIVIHRRLNAVFGALHGLKSMTTLLWAVNREVQGQTVSLPDWQKGLLVLYVMVAGNIGYESISHPKFFRGFTKFSNLLTAGALVYAALSAICYMAVVFQSDTKTFDLNAASRTTLTYTCFFFSLALGIFAAAKTRFRFQENHDGNQKLIEYAKSAKTFWNDAVTACRRKMNACCEEFEAGMRLSSEA